MIFQVDEWVLDNNGNTMQCVLSSQVASSYISIVEFLQSTVGQYQRRSKVSSHRQLLQSTDCQRATGSFSRVMSGEKNEASDENFKKTIFSFPSPFFFFCHQPITNRSFMKTPIASQYQLHHGGS